ncbi:MAG: hypothetical protein ACLU3I_07525 [Acutalibacteraceae bacterium]
MLQHDRQLTFIAGNLEKKIKTELLKLDGQRPRELREVLRRLRPPDQIRRSGRLRREEGNAARICCSTGRASRAS